MANRWTATLQEKFDELYAQHTDAFCPEVLHDTIRATFEADEEEFVMGGCWWTMSRDDFAQFDERCGDRNMACIMCCMQSYIKSLTATEAGVIDEIKAANNKYKEV